MTAPTSVKSRSNSKTECFRCICGAALLAVLLPQGHAADDAYLQLLDEEVVKVEEPATDTRLDDAASSRPAGRDQALQPVSRERFETLLKQTRAGTYSFYRRLPERSREEIFLDYSDGASLEALRVKIVDRYLHP
jgi:hypothetical protein